MTVFAVIKSIEYTLESDESAQAIGFFWWRTLEWGNRHEPKIQKAYVLVKNGHKWRQKGPKSTKTAAFCPFMR